MCRICNLLGSKVLYVAKSLLKKHARSWQTLAQYPYLVIISLNLLRTELSTTAHKTFHFIQPIEYSL